VDLREEHMCFLDLNDINLDFTVMFIWFWTQRMSVSLLMNELIMGHGAYTSLVEKLKRKEFTS